MYEARQAILSTVRMGRAYGDHAALIFDFFILSESVSPV